MEVAGGEHLGEAGLGLHVDEHDVWEVLGPLDEVEARRPAAVDDEHDVGARRERPGGGEDEVEGLGEPDVAGVHDDGAVPEAELGPVVRSPGRGLGHDRRRVDEVGDDVDPLGVVDTGCGELRPDVAGELVAEDRDGIRTPVGGHLEAAGGGDHPRVGEHAEFDGDVGKDVLDVEHERHPASAGHQPPGEAERERRRHGEHHVGPGARDGAFEGGEEGEPAEGERPGGDVGLVGGERVDPGDAPPGGVLMAHELAVPAGLEGVMAVPRQGSDDVEAVATCGETVGDGGDDLTGGRHVGGEVGAEDDDVHPAAPDVTWRWPRVAARRQAATSEVAPWSQLNPAARSRPAATRRRRTSRSSTTSAMARAQPSGSPGATSTPAPPTTSGRAVELAATTGQPSRMASRIGNPNPS